MMDKLSRKYQKSTKSGQGIQYLYEGLSLYDRRPNARQLLVGDMLKNEKRKSQFKYELGRLMGEYAVPLPLVNFSLNNKETRRLELWKNRRGVWLDHVEHLEEGQEQNKEWENFWWTVDEDMFTYVMKS